MPLDDAATRLIRVGEIELAAARSGQGEPIVLIRTRARRAKTTRWGAISVFQGLGNGKKALI